MLQGFIDVAGQANRYSRALNQQGCRSECWAYSQAIKGEPVNKWLELSKTGLAGGRIRKVGYFLEAFFRFNVWHIHKGFSLFHNAKDLELVRRAGKLLVIHYRGREVRPSMELNELPANIQSKVLRESKFANLVLVKDGQLAELIAPFVTKPIVFPNIVDVSSFAQLNQIPEDYYDEGRKLRVVHVPSNSEYKGSDFINAELSKIRDKVAYTKLSGVSRNELLSAYWSADVVIDQVLTGTYGNSALEGMALGRCVLNYLNKKFMSYEPEYPPIIDSSRFKIAETLVNLSENRRLVWKAGEHGRRFVERHHSYSSVASKLVQYYRNSAW